MRQIPQKTHSDYTVAVICALDFEMSSFRFMMDEEHARLSPSPGDQNRYLFGGVHGLNVVLACLPGTQGKGAAAILMTNLSRSFPSIQYKFLVGIGGGVPSVKDDIRLGDVVVSMPKGDTGGVAQYDLGKATENGVVLKGYLWPSATLVRSAIMIMRSDHEVKPNALSANVEAMCSKLLKPKKYARPDKEDILYEASVSSLEDVDSTWEIASPTARSLRASSDPEIHYGLIASGDSVIKSAAERQSINERLGGDVLCFEMEAAGLLTEEPCMVIRGISDYGDAHKNDDWQYYAAATASACAKEIISYIRSQDLIYRHGDSSKGNAQPPAPTLNSFNGRGIQNPASGNVTAGRDIVIS